MTSTPHGRLSDLLALKWNERGELNAMDRIHLLEVLNFINKYVKLFLHVSHGICRDNT